MMKLPGALATLALLAGAFVFFPARASSPSPIQFVYQPIPFQLESNETPARNAPETMAGGVAIFDYNRDGRPDIFFTNGGNIATLKKDSPKYRNRLFRNDGNGVFTDVTEAAGLDDNNRYQTRDLFVSKLQGKTPEGRLIAELIPTGGHPSFAQEPYEQGLTELIHLTAPIWEGMRPNREELSGNGDLRKTDEKPSGVIPC